MSSALAWVVLFFAGLCEIGWAVGLKYTEGFTRLWPSMWTLAAMAASVVLLGWSLKALPLGTAYTVWTGIGAVGAFVVGILFLGEPVTAMRLVAGSLIVGGLVLMKMSSS